MFRYREFSPIHDHDASQNQIEKLGARPDCVLNGISLSYFN